MKKRTIEKLLQCSGEVCPSFKYDNPLLDIDVAKKLSSSIVKQLNNYQQEKYSDLRSLILKKVRESCKNVPDDHLYNDEYVTEILQDTYEDLLKNQSNNTTDTDKMLDTFLIRNMKELTISSYYPSLLLSTPKPEVIKAITNLKYRKEIDKILLKDIIYWNVKDGDNNLHSDIIKSMWNKETLLEYELQYDDISIKSRTDIEMIMLKYCYEIIETEIICLEDWLSMQQDLRGLLKICAVSSECFQICCCIINAVFIKTNFNRQMENFIHAFIELVKEDFITSKLLFFSLLYPNRLRHIVLLLNVDIMSLPSETKRSYISCTLEHLTKLRHECEIDLIMLLSHFKQWFDIYYDNQYESSQRK